VIWNALYRESPEATASSCDQGLDSIFDPSAGMPDFVAMPAALAPSATEASNAPTRVSLFDQGLIQVLEAAVSGLQPKQPYVLALAENPDGTGVLQPLQFFMTNPAGAAIVNSIGPIRQLVETDVKAQRRYLVIVPATGTTLGTPVQVQVP
jgi:hypothetical protein